jgi:hypothetical protein
VIFENDSLLVSRDNLLMSTQIPFKSSLTLLLSSVVALVGCSIYRSPDRESFNTNARAGAPVAVAIALLECNHVNGTLEGTQLESVQINRASSDGIHVFMIKRMTSSTPQAVLCHFVTSQENSASDQSLSDAIRPIVEHYLLNGLTATR